MLTAGQIDQAAGSDGDQPAVGIGGDTLLRPLNGGREQRLLRRVLARVETSVAADECAEHLRRGLAQQVLDTGSRAHISIPAENITGRTSTPIPFTFASGISAANSSARCLLSQSMR
jgi:hypothetical protein